MSAPLEIGLLLFPRLTQLDMTGPFEVFTRLPGARVRLLWKQAGPVQSDSGLTMLADTALADCPQLDIICVPGGPGVAALMEDEELLAFLRRQAAGARYVTSVCTGALVLGAAGLLRGYRATTHWLSMDLLPVVGATPIEGARGVIDRNRVTAGGVTAGLDFGLAIVERLRGARAAEQIQLMIEYDPAPPFSAGSPEDAPPDLVDAIRSGRKDVQKARREALERAMSRL